MAGNSVRNRRNRCAARRDACLPQTGPLKLPQTGPLKLPEGKPAPPRYCETPMQILLILGGVVLLVLIGIFPQAFFPLTHGLIEGFVNLP